jgi:lipoteichoic acid synthase
MQINLNVVVIFIEGIYARLLGTYGGKFENLTPSLDSLTVQDNVMKVDNYFNHTNATFAGVSDTFGSFFPIDDGVGGWFAKEKKDLAKNFPVLTNLLKKINYETCFASGDNSEIFSFFLEKIGLDNVITSKTKKDTDGTKNLISTLKSLENSNQNFFLGFYNLGTHTFIDANQDDKSYKDGKNTILNRMHNFDDEFKNFIEYFFNSKLKENTLLIIASDYTTYHEPSTKQIIPDYNNCFVNQIPLFIYIPNINLKKEMNAESSTSLDLAPTILHLLNKNIPNAFLGKSLFEERQFNFAVAYRDGSHFIFENNVYCHGKNTPEDFKKSFETYKDYMQMQLYYE